MSINYSTAVKNARLNAVLSALGASGKLVIMASDNTVLANIPLSNPAGTVNNGVLTLTSLQADNTTSGTGTASKAELRDGSSTVVASGLTVGTSGTDVILSNTAINTGNIVTLTSATITHG